MISALLSISVYLTLHYIYNPCPVNRIVNLSTSKNTVTHLFVAPTVTLSL